MSIIEGAILRLEKILELALNIKKFKQLLRVGVAPTTTGWPFTKYQRSSATAWKVIRINMKF